MSALRVSLLVSAALGLAACAPQVPDSGASYQSYMRNAQGGAYQQPAQTAAAPQGFSTEGALAAINAADGSAPAQNYGAQPSYGAPTSGYEDPNRPRGNAPTNIRSESGEMTSVYGSMSDENNFAAVSAERSIAEDAAVIAQNRANYQQIAPTAIPQRPNDSQNGAVVQFALQTSHPKGQQMYSRSSIRLTNSQKACAQYMSPDQAQAAFLEGGGPQRDRRGLDPDGDGYACGWDPAPYRAALR